MPKNMNVLCPCARQKEEREIERDRQAALREMRRMLRKVNVKKMEEEYRRTMVRIRKEIEKEEQAKAKAKEGDSA